MAKKKDSVAKPSANKKPPAREVLEDVPTYTLRADEKRSLLAMIALEAYAHQEAPDTVPEIAKRLRDFELYQEGRWTGEVPTYTLRADRRQDLLALIAVVALVHQEVPKSVAEFDQKLREFELYEEKHRR
jgi:hypothetical protein